MKEHFDLPSERYVNDLSEVSCIKSHKQPIFEFFWFFFLEKILSENKEGKALIVRQQASLRRKHQHEPIPKGNITPMK